MTRHCTSGLPDVLRAEQPTPEAASTPVFSTRWRRLTGGSRDIGAATGLRLAREGSDSAVTGLEFPVNGGHSA